MLLLLCLTKKEILKHVRIMLCKWFLLSLSPGLCRGGHFLCSSKMWSICSFSSTKTNKKLIRVILQIKCMITWISWSFFTTWCLHTVPILFGCLFGNVVGRSFWIWWKWCWQRCCTRCWRRWRLRTTIWRRIAVRVVLRVVNHLSEFKK